MAGASGRSTPVAPPVALGVATADPIRQAHLLETAREHGLRVVLSVDSGRRLLDGLWRTLPDVVVVDTLLTDCDGRDICRAVRMRDVDCRLVLLVPDGSPRQRILGLHAGADVCLTEDQSLVDAIRTTELL